MQDPQKLYREILTNSFEKIKKALPKKLKPLKDTITAFADQLKTDDQLDANRYFIIFKQCIESKEAKLIEICMNNIYKLISHSFLTGNSSDIPTDVPGSDGQNGEVNSGPKSRRRLVDTIIESICSCKNDKNENVQMLIVRTLLTMVAGLTNEVHGDSLQETLDSLFAIYSSSKTPENQVATKAGITQIVNIVFQRMEEYNSIESDFLQIQKEKKKGKTIRPEKKIPIRGASLDPSPQMDNSRLSRLGTKSLNIQIPQQQRLSLQSSHSPFPMSPNNPANGTFAAVLERFNFDFAEAGAGSPVEGETPSEKYLGLLVKNIVDDVCIHQAKQDELRAEYEKEPEDEDLKFELENIPLRAVPSACDSGNPQYRKLHKAGIENEKGVRAGYFGWCFVCREAADLYCKDNRIPVCSVDCKTKHLEILDNLNKPVKTYEVLANTMYIEDAAKVFEYLCKLSGKDKANDLSQTSQRNKTFSLELIASIMANAGPVFFSAKEFRSIVKENLCGSLFSNSISVDKPTFAFSIEIFTSLMTYFKESLKAEVGVFIENILIHMLESGNSSYNHKFLALQVLHKLTSGPKIVLEFYVNYDCNINSTSLVERIVEILCKIAQGKFSRSEYSSLIVPVQELHLKTLALDSLVLLVKSLVQFTMDHQKHENKRQDEAEKTIKLNSLDNEKDFEENDSDDGEEEGEGMSAVEKEEKINNQRKLKKEFHQAIEKFNFKIKHGMKYLAQLGFINLEDAKSVAKFFKTTPGLSKEKLGEYFGEEHEFNIKVMTEWMDLLEFTDLTLDDGLRKLLEQFILPGEGQKIDRIVQVYAGKFFKDNPKSFNSANAAYTLSYLLIMLQTDAYNPNIKEKDRMKLPAFIKLARGINDGDNLPEEELVGYYNRILETPLGIHTMGETKKLVSELQGQSIKRKERQFQLETVKMLVKGQTMLKQKQDDQMYFKIKNTDSIRPLFKDIIWSPVLAVFSVLLEKSEDPKIINLCIQGFTNCILLTGLHNMDTERDTFVSSLAKFTNLSSGREIRDKNIKCLETLLNIASTHGHSLGMSWLFVLECISKIDYYLNNFSSKDHDHGAFDLVEFSKSEVVKNIVDIHSINCIFSRSSSFELEEIMDFISCICKTADEELKNPQQLRTYSLQKLVEVAHFNLDRIKFIWTKIWQVTREYISHVAINSTPEIGFFAVDSLKQLSLKFLVKEELANLEFQKDFLIPFGTIFQRVESNDIKELILTCCGYIISHVGEKLKSGWKTILNILGLGAESDKKNIIAFSFQIAESIVNERMSLLQEITSEFIILFIKFSRCKSEEIATKSLVFLKKLIDKMIRDNGSKPTNAEEEDTIMEKSHSDENPQGELQNGEAEVIAAQSSMSEGNWITLLTSLFTLCSDSKKKIRREGTTILFEILKNYGQEFSTDFWQVVLSGVIKPLFDEIQFYFQSKSEEELVSYNDSCREIFLNMIDVYYIYYDKLSSFTEDFLKILMHCIDNPKGNLAKISINALKQLITQCHTKFSDKEWSMMVNSCLKIVQNTTPYQLMEFQIGDTKLSARDEGAGQPKNRKNVSIKSEENLTQCIVQLLMIALIKDVADTYDQYLSDEQLEVILETLNASYTFAKNFNEQIYLRFCLWKNGLMKEMDQLPGLLKQGKEALGAYILILYKLYKRQLNSNGKESSRKYLQEFLSLGIQLMSMLYTKGEEYHVMIQEEKDRGYQADSPARMIRDPFNFNDQNLRESFDRQAPVLTLLELEKEIMNTRTILSMVFLPKLAELDPQETKDRVKEISKQLIDISIYCTPKQLAISEESARFVKIYATNDETLLLIRMLLNKYLEFNFS